MDKVGEAQDVAKIGSRKLSCLQLWCRVFKMKPKMWPRLGQESFLGEISSLEISR